MGYVFCDDIIDEMVSQLSYLKLKTSIELSKEK